jgi:GrpB-like predicted nucleotidyltransferase (UPF0157 family)
MKLKINPYNKEASERFNRQKNKILKAIGNFEVHHIGSTAVPGLGGKGIVDILIGIDNWGQATEIIERLKGIGFLHVHLKEKGRIFLSKNTGLSLTNIHIHIAIKQSNVYKEILFFRNYLRENKKEAKNYYNLKKAWLKESNGDRKEYSDLKNKYINNILKNNI